jgi:hypothetical protein
VAAVEVAAGEVAVAEVVVAAVAVVVGTIHPTSIDVILTLFRMDRR